MSEERKTGHSKLVYDKAKRTIVTVTSPETKTPFDHSFERLEQAQARIAELERENNELRADAEQWRAHQEKMRQALEIKSIVITFDEFVITQNGDGVLAARAR